ncbi:MAG: glycosyltransferase family 4 protein [Nitrospirae bacterium]|nr:MAG: glycosyltransferase family 4 protein [Nitrospirota bacterium]
MPRTGGLAIFGSVLLGILLCVALGEGAVFQAPAILWILGMALLLGVVSFWDDRTGLSPGLRLGVQALAAAGVVWGAGLAVPSIPVPFIGSLPLGWLAVPVTMLFLMWMANLYNFMDGMDGFAGGMTVLGYGFLGVMAWEHDHYLMGLAILIGAAAGGFLLYNLPPARIFMGDVGSVPLGFIAGALAVLGTRDGLFDIWTPLLIFSPFIMDATVTLVGRLLRGKNVWRAHREHYYQRLVLAGWGHRRTVLAEYALMLACGLSAVLYGRSGESLRLAILLGWVGIYGVLAWGVRRVEGQARAVGADGCETLRLPP